MSETKKVTVEVTQEDIDNSIWIHRTRCPVALAIARALGLQPGSVGVSIGQWCSPGLRYRDLPDAAHSWYRAFDNGQPVKPFSFEIEVPA